MGLVIVDIVHLNDVAAFEPEDHAPITGYINGPEIPELSMQRMQSQSRRIHLFRSGCRCEQRQDQIQPLGMLGLNPFGATGLVIKLQPFMPKTSDHRLNVTYMVTAVKQRKGS